MNILPARLFCCFLAITPVFANPVYAQVTGKLFTSEEERTYLDYLREEFLARNQTTGFNIADTEVPAIPGEEVTPVLPREYTLKGIMTRRDGSRSVWLNDLTIDEADLPADISIVEINGILALHLATPSGNHALRPGQTLEIYSGSIQEQYQRPVVQEEEKPSGLIGTALSLLSDDSSDDSSDDNSDTPEPADQTAQSSGQAGTVAPPAVNGVSALPAALLASGLPLGLRQPPDNPENPPAENSEEELPGQAEAEANPLDSIIKNLETIKAAFDATKQP